MYLDFKNMTKHQECRNKITVIPKWLPTPSIQRPQEFLDLGNVKKKIKVGAFIVTIHRKAFESIHVSRLFFFFNLEAENTFNKE